MRSRWVCRHPTTRGDTGSARWTVRGWPRVWAWCRESTALSRLTCRREGTPHDSWVPARSPCSTDPPPLTSDTPSSTWPSGNSTTVPDNLNTGKLELQLLSTLIGTEPYLNRLIPDSIQIIEQKRKELNKDHYIIYRISKLIFIKPNVQCIILI